MRLFVAVEVPGSVQAAVAVATAGLRAAEPRLRWVDPAKYHLTVAFLGAVDEGLVDDIAAAVARACVDVSAFDLRLDGTVGTFGRRVLWAGLERSEQLVALAAAVQSSLAPVVALPDADRPYSAHLTLARSGRSPVRRDAVADVALPRLSWRVERAVLMRSAGGYSVQRAFPFADANA